MPKDSDESVSKTIIRRYGGRGFISFANVRTSLDRKNKKMTITIQLDNGLFGEELIRSCSMHDRIKFC